MNRLLITCLSIGGLFASHTALATPNDNGSILQKRGTYYIPSPGETSLGTPSAIYLHRDGGNFGSGYVPAFEQGDDAWKELVECVKYQYAQFDIAVTDSQPSGRYITAVVGGSASDIGGSGFCGIAPFRCSPQYNVVVYNHSTCYPGDMEQLCFTVAQETAHALGLEHQMTCTDPLTYLTGCGFKQFQNEYGDCGEFSSRACDCGGSTQNTVAHLTSYLGTVSDGTNPNLLITSPQQDAYVSFGFPINVTATDNRAMGRVEVYLDGTMLVERRFPPYNFKAPNSLALGDHDLEIRAYDWAGNQATLSRHVFATVDGNPPQCMTNTDCGTDETCYNFQCWPNDGGDPPPMPGETGAPCNSNDDCTGGICATSAGESKCTEQCTSADSCPTGFDCVDAGGTSICWPGSGGNDTGGGSDSGGCSVDTSTSSSAGAMMLLFFALLFARRRRRS